MLYTWVTCKISLSAKTLDLALQWRNFDPIFIHCVLQSIAISHTAVTHISCLWFILLYRAGLHLPYSHNPTTASPSIPYDPMDQAQLTSWNGGHRAGASATPKLITWLMLRRKVYHHMHAQEKKLEGSGYNQVPTVRWTWSPSFSPSPATPPSFPPYCHPGQCIV